MRWTLLREIAEIAKQSGVAVSLYPHKGCYAQRMEDVVRLAKKTDRPNVGVTFTFCHFLAVDDAKNLDGVLKMARPYLTMVTINGTSGYGSGNLASWIQVLGEGTFDVGAVLKALRKLDYRGPIGIIAYGVKGDHREILSRSIQAWKKLSAEAAAEKYAHLSQRTPNENENRHLGGLDHVGEPLAGGYLRRQGGGPLLARRRADAHREDGHTERWCLAAWLPADLLPGQYDVLVHGGHGGDYGWSDPLALTVAAEKPPTGPTINVRDLGAKGDGVSDDTEPLSAALMQATGGGSVLLPPGTYAITRSLLIPERVIVRGTGMHQSVIANLETASFRPGERTDSPRRDFRPALVHGMGRFVLQDLTLRFMPATAPAPEIGRDEVYVQDVGLYRVRFESRQDYGLSQQHDYTTPPVSIYNARRLRMVRCETFGPGGVTCQRKLEDCQFSQNRFTADRRWRGHMFKFWVAEHCVFEDNLLTGDTRGLVMQTHFGVNYQNFIAGNTVERTVLGDNAGETYLVEGAGLFLESPVAEASPATLTTTRWPTVHDEANPHQKVVGRFVVVARGRGLASGGGSRPLSRRRGRSPWIALGGSCPTAPARWSS